MSTRCCLLYTSDAADERSSVDLGGRRIIKKKKDRAIYGTHVRYNYTGDVTTLTSNCTSYVRVRQQSNTAT